MTNFSNLFQNFEDIKFLRKLTKNSHEHIQAFLMSCKVVNHEEILVDAFQMHLFPHTLKDNARKWLHLLFSGAIISWNDMVRKFTLKFSHHIEFIKSKMKFKQNDLESNSEVWMRFKDYFKKWPNLNIPKSLDLYHLSSNEFSFN